MIELKVQFPYIDNDGKQYDNLIKYWAEDTETGKPYYIEQIETNVLYDEAVDLYPSAFTYRATDILIEEVDDGSAN